MRHFHFFDTTTGVIHSDTVAINAAVGLEKAALANCPAGHKPIEGNFDRLSQRVDTATGQVVEYQPPQPSSEHEWDATAKRWKLSAAVADRQARRSAALAEIARLEASQARPLRELALTPGDPAALARLRKIEALIHSLRVSAP